MRPCLSVSVIHTYLLPRAVLQKGSPSPGRPEVGGEVGVGAWGRAQNRLLKEEKGAGEKNMPRWGGDNDGCWGKWQEGCPEHWILDAAPSGEAGLFPPLSGPCVALGRPEARPAQSRAWALEETGSPCTPSSDHPR